MNLDPEWFEGLVPKVILVVGTGYQREQIKDAVIQQVESVAGEWIFSSDQLASGILKGAGRAPELLTASGRQEFLRLLFSDRRVLSRFPLLKSLKRQEGFYRRLDQAVIAFREVVGHEQERAVLEERLQALGVGNPERRAEVAAVSAALEVWMESVNVADSPRLFRMAIDRLTQLRDQGDVPRLLKGRELLVQYQVQASQSLEALFFDELRNWIPIYDGALSSTKSEKAWIWKRSHTLHDSAELLVDELLKRDWSRQVILIPDTAADVRMVLRRSLHDAGIPEGDPRDPQEVRLDESYKRVFLPLECVASSWDSAKTVSFLSATLKHHELDRMKLMMTQRRLLELGQRPGIQAVLRAASELPRDTLLQMENLERSFNLRLDFETLRKNHTEQCHWFIASQRIEAWLEKFWNDFESDLRRVQLLEKRFPLAIWLERIRGRVELSSPPVSPFKPAEGVRIIRMSQANAISDDPEVWILGPQASWLSPPTDADFYLGAREREILSSEFQVRSAIHVKESRRRALESWINSASAVHILDHAFELDGSESEPCDLLLAELGAPDDLGCQQVGAHHRFLESYGLVKRALGSLIELSPVPPSGSLSLSATALDAMSRCSFLGLVRARWKLMEREVADWELWPRVRGVLLHRAAEWLADRIESGSGVAESASLLPGEMAKQCWSAVWSEALAAGEVPGWIRSPQLERQIERQSVEILSNFIEKEMEYRGRSGIRCLATEEDARLMLRWADAQQRSIELTGKADRIDEHPEGLFVLDYKTGVQAFKGGDIREKGYRLQLPFYALAARARFQKPVLGVQLVELTRDGRRSVGLFPKRLNGKEKGCLTQLGKTNSGLFESDPDELWSSLEQKIHEVVNRFADGRFEASPTMGAKECQECEARLVCGLARREWVQGAPSAESGEEGGAE